MDNNNNKFPNTNDNTVTRTGNYLPSSVLEANRTSNIVGHSKKIQDMSIATSVEDTTELTDLDNLKSTIPKLDKFNQIEYLQRKIECSDKGLRDFSYIGNEKDLQPEYQSLSQQEPDQHLQQVIPETVQQLQPEFEPSRHQAQNTQNITFIQIDEQYVNDRKQQIEIHRILEDKTGMTKAEYPIHSLCHAVQEGIVTHQPHIDQQMRNTNSLMAQKRCHPTSFSIENPESKIQKIDSNAWVSSFK